MQENEIKVKKHKGDDGKNWQLDRTGSCERRPRRGIVAFFFDIVYGLDTMKISEWTFYANQIDQSMLQTGLHDTTNSKTERLADFFC